MASDSYSNSSDDHLASEINNPPRSPSCNRQSEEEYDENMQEQQFGQDEDPEDTTEYEQDRKGKRAINPEDGKGEFIDGNQERHGEETFNNNRKSSAPGLDSQLVDLAIQMMLAGQVNIPAKVYREYQKQKEVSLKNTHIFSDRLTNYTIF